MLSAVFFLCKHPLAPQACNLPDCYTINYMNLQKFNFQLDKIPREE
jgi:hypothetical protein